MNRYGESRKILHDGDEVGGHVSVKQRQSEKIEKLGTFAAAASIFKAFVGLGILFLPFQFWETGTAAMPVIMAGSLVLTVYCTTLLMATADQYGGEFSSIAKEAYGDKARILTQVLIICSQMGFCINYIYFISSQVGSIFNCVNRGGDLCAQSTEVRENVQIWYFLPALFCIYVPLCWIRDMEKLAWSHLVGNILILLVVVSVTYFSTSNIVKHSTSPQAAFTPLFFKAIPYSAFAFEGVAVVMPLREIVADQKNYMKLVMIVLTVIYCLYVLFSEYAVLSYGNQEEYITIMDALPSTSPATYTLKSLYTVNLFFSYPMQLTPAFDIIESFIWPHDQKATKGQYWAQNVLRAGIVAFTICAALLLYPIITVFIEVIAAATCSPLAFTLPALFHYKLMGGNKAHLAIAIITTVLTVFMVAQSIYTLVKELTGDEE